MSQQTLEQRTATRLSLNARSVAATIELLNGGATIPFIARYRKEATGQLDEVQIGQISETYRKLAELDKRRDTILNAISEQGQLTPDLRRKIETADSLTDLEDLYLPYRQKRKTRATCHRTGPRTTGKSAPDSARTRPAAGRATVLLRRRTDGK